MTLPKANNALMNTYELIKRYCVGIEHDPRGILSHLFFSFIKKIQTNNRIIEPKEIHLPNLLFMVARLLDAVFGMPICESQNSSENMRLEYACADLSGVRIGIDDTIKNQLIYDKFVESPVDEYCLQLLIIQISLLDPFIWECKSAENSSDLFDSYGSLFSGLYRALLRGSTKLVSVLEEEASENDESSPSKAFYDLHSHINGSNNEICIINNCKQYSSTGDSTNLS
jgi:hypothetical protein